LMLAILKPFWDAVHMIFPADWGLPSRKSRLTHGAGIIALGFLMDAIAEPLLDSRLPQREDFMIGLKKVAPICAWSSGSWDFAPDDQRKWNDLQNLPRDIQTLTSYVLFELRRRSSTDSKSLWS